MGWFRQFRQRVSRRIFGAPDYRPIIQDGLARMHDVLAGTSLAPRIWINGGILLGYIREGGPMRQDNDADFSIWDHDVPQLQALFPKFADAGLKPYIRWTNNAGESTVWTLKYRDLKFEFFVMTRVQNCIQWYCYGDKPVQEFVCQTPMHGLEPFKLFNRTWNKPDDHATYLESLYGDWRTPNSNYCYFRDSRAIVSRCPWKGTKQW